MHVMRLRGEAFVLIAISLSAAFASSAEETPDAGTQPGNMTDLLPPYVISTHAREAAETQLTSSSEGEDHNPALSPDGAWLAFASTRDSATPQLYRRAVDGSGMVRRLTSTPGARVQAAIAPDGKEIACAGEVAGSWDIVILPAEGGSETFLTTTPDFDEIHPAWSPSGDALAYSRRDPADGVWWICVKRRDEATASRICEGLNPEWNPAGDLVVFQRPRGRGRGEFALWTVEVAQDDEVGESSGDASGSFALRGGATKLYSSTSAGAVGPAFGPRGEWIVFISIALSDDDQAAAPRGGEIMVVRTDGTGLRRLPTSRSVCRSPAWVRGRIVFSSDDDDGRARIWSVPADGAASQ
jgi:Tol biopolymer transport system component